MNILRINGKNYKITRIADEAFKNCKKLKKVTIGANVAKIGKKASYGCRNLKRVVVKSKVLKKVGYGAFKKAHASIKIKLPKKKASAYKKLLRKGV